MLIGPSGPSRRRRRAYGWPVSYSGSRLRTGASADPPTLSAAVPDWPIGSRIYLGKRTLQVIGRRDDDADLPPTLIVEDVNS